MRSRNVTKHYKKIMNKATFLLQNSIGILFVYIACMIADKRLISISELIRAVNEAYNISHINPLLRGGETS